MNEQVGSRSFVRIDLNNIFVNNKALEAINQYACGLGAILMFYRRFIHTLKLKWLTLLLQSEMLLNRYTTLQASKLIYLIPLFCSSGYQVETFREARTAKLR